MLTGMEGLVFYLKQQSRSRNTYIVNDDGWRIELEADETTIKE